MLGAEGGDLAVSRARHSHITLTAATIAVAAVCCAPAIAQPLFSVAPNGPSMLNPDVVYQNTGGGVPVAVGGGPGMGLGAAGDDIIGLAPLIVEVGPFGRITRKFVICFSSDPFSVGVSRFRITGQNLFRQAANNQQAGDAFLSTEAFERGVGVLPPPFSMGLNNNALAVNQSPFYPNDFALLPAVDPRVFVLPDTPLDDVDATLNFTDATPPTVFFTLSGDSPSHGTLPGPDSGATIFFDPDFQMGGNETVFANPGQLLLDIADQIDGLIVFDDNLNGVLDGTDAVYFSLAPDSPTLLALGLEPGDVLAFENGNLSLFTPGTVLGLVPGDNMNALDYVPLVNDSAEDTINAMVMCPSDYDGNTFINTSDVLVFLNLWVPQDPAADFNGDGQVDTSDVLDFLNAWADGC